MYGECSGKGCGMLQALHHPRTSTDRGQIVPHYQDNDKAGNKLHLLLRQQADSIKEDMQVVVLSVQLVL